MNSPQKKSIYTQFFSCEKYYDQDISFSQLCANDFLEISIVTKGSGVHQVLNQVIPCRQNDIYIVPAHIPHGYFLTEESSVLSVRKLLVDLKDWVSEDVSTPGSARFCYGAFHEGGAIAYAMLNSLTVKEVILYLDMIESEISAAKLEWHAAVSAHISMLLITVGRYVSDTIQNLPKIKEKEWLVVSPAIRILLEDFKKSNLTLESIASNLYVSKAHLSRLFKRLTGNTFTQYLRNVRLSHACRLLKGTDLSVEEIVEACGLRDIPNFYRIFNSYTNMTPNQYRTTHNEKKQNTKGEKNMIILNEIAENLQAGKAKMVKEMVQQAIDEGCPCEEILSKGLLAGMSIIGEKFKNNEIFVPEVLIAARAMNQGVAILKPLLVKEGVQSAGTVCIGTVQGDLHDIGKNLVKMMFEGKGLSVIDLGTDVAPETFIKAAIEHNCKVICCSSLLTTTMGVMKDVVKAAEDAGIRDKVKIMVGGAPVSEEFCREIGADCYTVDAASAADAAVRFCNELR